jgi:hypothetical protein
MLEQTWSSLLTDNGELDMARDGEVIEDLCRDMERAAELIRELSGIIAKYQI